MSGTYAHRSSGRGAPAAPPPYESWNPTGIPGATSNRRQPGANTSRPPDEQTTLLPRHNDSRGERGRISITSLLLYTIMAYLFFNFIIQLKKGSEETLDPVARDRIRREWDKEIRGHEAVRRAWSVEQADMETIRLGWETERQELIDMREQLVRDKEQWARDRDEEKREEERRKREEEDRIRAGFAWDGLQGDHRCLQHGTRRYTARLANVPREYDPVKACTETAVEIHGVKISSPNHCEDRGCGGVIGHWIVDYSEPACATHFDNFKDKGCTSPGSGRRRIESHLENLQYGDDWRAMCSTTPANFRHLHFESPHVCEDWGKYGIWGIWEIEDAGC